MIGASRIRWATSALLLLAGSAGCAEEASEPREAGGLFPGSDSFIFDGSPGARDRPIRVWYHVPEGLGPDARILFVLHGSVRNGRDYHNVWIPLAEQYRFVLFSPEFSRAYYPTNADYRWGGIVSAESDPVDGEPVDPELWSIRTVSDLFDEVRSRFGLTSPHYSIYGHSAGGQFVHRSLLFRPDPRVKTYIAANSGTFTMPSLESAFPYGLGGDPAGERQAETRLEEALQRRLIVLMGEADTSTVLSAPNMTPEALAQGASRFERAERFFQVARDEAADRGLPFRWEFRVVPGVGHSNPDMAESAVRSMAW